MTELAKCPKCGAGLFTGHGPRTDRQTFLCGTIFWANDGLAESPACLRAQLAQRDARIKAALDYLDGGFDRDYSYEEMRKVLTEGA